MKKNHSLIFGAFLFLAASFAEPADDPMEYLQSAYAVPYFKDGRMIGMQIKNIETDSAFAANYGIQVGDILIRFNKTAVVGSELLTMAKALPQKTTRLTVVRNGREVVLANKGIKPWDSKPKNANATQPPPKDGVAPPPPGFVEDPE